MLIVAKLGIAVEIAPFRGVNGITGQAHRLVPAAFKMHCHLAGGGMELICSLSALAALAGELAAGESFERFHVATLAFQADVRTAGHVDDVAWGAKTRTVWADLADNDMWGQNRPPVSRACRRRCRPLLRHPGTRGRRLPHRLRAQRHALPSGEGRSNTAP